LVRKVYPGDDYLPSLRAKAEDELLTQYQELVQADPRGFMTKFGESGCSVA
jgi:hypothetical protein